MQCLSDKCRKRTPKGRKYCYKHLKQRYKEKNPVRYAYSVLKNNAKRRKKDFDLTFEQFQKFCYETDILAGRGITKESFHIDRKEDDKGYTINNIQVLTNSENSKKEQRRRKLLKYDIEFKVGSFVEIDKVEDSPF